MMRRPMLWVVACYAAGIGLGWRLGLDCFLALPMCVGSWILAALMSHTQVVGIGMAIFSTGMLSIAVDRAILSPCDLRLSQGEAPALAGLIGELMETPAVEAAEAGVSSMRWHVPLRVCLRSDGRLWKAARGVVMIHAQRISGTNLFRGMLIEARGVLAAPPRRKLPGLFDYREYLRQKGIYYTLALESPGDCLVLSPTTSAPQLEPPWDARFVAWGRRILRLGLPEEDEAWRLQCTMALGWKPGLNQEVSEPFMRSGTLHVFAVSGLHISLVALVFVRLLRCLRLSPAVSGLVSIPIIWLYTFATGFEASAVRSAVMTTVVSGGWALRRPSDLLNSLGAAAAIILVFDPQQLFMAGFQLSFVAVFYLAWTATRLQLQVDKLCERDPLLPSDLETRSSRWRRQGLRWVSTLILPSTVAWVGSVPVVAYYFHLVTPVSVLANVIIVPLSGLALTSALGSLFVGEWLPGVAELFNHSGWFWMWCMIHLSAWFAELPGAFWYVEAPSAFTVISIFVTLAAVGSASFWGRSSGWKSFAGLVVGILAVCVGVEWARTPRLRMDVLPLDGGEATLLSGRELPAPILIDCGTSNATSRLVLPLLRARGVDRLGALILTHGDLRHYGGAESLKTQVPVETLIVGDVRYRSKGYNAVVGAYEKARIPVRRLGTGDRVGPLVVLHPPRGFKATRADDLSMVMSLDASYPGVVLGSDLGSTGQRNLLARTSGKAQSISLWVTGFPAGGEPLGDELMTAFKPRGIWVQSARFPTGEQLRHDTRERLRRWGSEVFEAHREGGVQVLADPKEPVLRLQLSDGTSLRIEEPIENLNSR